MPAIKFKSSDLKQIQMNEGWKIKGISDIQPLGSVAIICEVEKDSKLVFMELHQSK